ncbi:MULTISPECIES: lytic transglycosylase domain-containing protein [unclassified Fusibacter]|uniref:lytic transglycosylase domain-containing protein n=1 Tax=unclassified Fusibacter TaxID=2624464 RepID=UPI0010109499|nr:MULTISPECIES: transglycosylase SLT domain-containing protein [unclassified Fusibacter]MCK8059427.1 transglycosylase SLT domain-containing protein [Fusibacter sp. A2]NPE21109.1 transglycosylase SLT domain-containing protein [Fusibacter sp. A1]RXV62379.1 hypothetical protein DWB64_04685 [Fusibacter sp. A1]
MFSKGKIHAHILLIVIIVMLLFAIGASYQTITKDQNILNTVDVEHGQRETELLNQINDQEERIIKLRKQNLELSKKVTDTKEKEVMFDAMHRFLEIINYSEEEVKRAYQVFEETPLDFESSLYLIKYTDLYDIDPSLVLSIIEIESNFDAEAVGGAADRGLMQIIPATEKWLAEEFGNEIGITYDPDLIFEPEYNLGLALSYIHLLKNAYGENYHRILSEYNRGPYNLAKYFEANHTYQTTYSRAILSRVDKYDHID